MSRVVVTIEQGGGCRTGCDGMGRPQVAREVALGYGDFVPGVLQGTTLGASEATAGRQAAQPTPITMKEEDTVRYGAAVERAEAAARKKCPPDISQGHQPSPGCLPMRPKWDGKGSSGMGDRAQSGGGIRTVGAGSKPAETNFNVTSQPVPITFTL